MDWSEFWWALLLFSTVAGALLWVSGEIEDAFFGDESTDTGPGRLK